MVAAKNAPTNVPKAWAKKGIKKFIGLNRCMDSCNPSIVVMSAPSGGGIIEPLIIMRAIFTTPPTTSPVIRARIFLAIGFIFVDLIS
jgi:hypothetical protein